MAELASAIIAGASLASTSIQEISHAIGTNRNCTVEITNYCRETMKEPNVYCYSGYVKDPLPVFILPQQREAASFTKVSDTACGSVFVFSYELTYSMRFAILVSVPYDQGCYENWFGATFIDADSPTDYDLYYRMYYKSANDGQEKLQRSKAGKTLTVSKDGFTVSGTMSDSYQAVVKISVFNDHGCNSGPTEGPNGTLQRWQWIGCSNGHLPSNFVTGGEEGGQTLVVIRAYVNGALTPGKLIKGDRHGLIPWGGIERQVQDYEVLVGHEHGIFRWQPSSQGYKHTNAVVAGKSEDGDELLVGRVVYNGAKHPGKIHPRCGKCFISYRGEELAFSDYEILLH